MNYPLSLLVGYAIVAIVLGGLLLLAVLSSIIIYYLHKRNLNSYRQLQTDEDNEEDNQVVKPKTEIDKPKDIFIEEFDGEAASFSTEAYAEHTESNADFNADYQSVSLYGDKGWRFSALSSDITPGPATIHLSLVLNTEKKYLAGKVTKIAGIPLPERGERNQVKVHVSLLPTRRYILKTKYHDISGSSKFDEYFKTRFTTIPNKASGALRFRLYRRRIKYGISGKERCLGECFVGLDDVAKTHGGLTLVKEIVPKGIKRVNSGISLP